MGSTSDQNLKTQIDLFDQIGCEKIYSDIANGVRRDDRKGFNEMLTYLRKGEIVIVYKTNLIFRPLEI
ncbi:recombinase family protein [Chryseobacterium sp. HR92]|uniref:recombinase family protein n=1 Tax=Chryseobacterium sp. HR92 TaxID=3094839 RepID=UPI00388E26A1|nr:recombinase family protein [Chryseobacterium sp. HR92]